MLYSSNIWKSRQNGDNLLWTYYYKTSLDMLMWKWKCYSTNKSSKHRYIYNGLESNLQEILSIYIFKLDNLAKLLKTLKDIFKTRITDTKIK